MPALEDYEQRGLDASLEELAAIANALLPKFLPALEDRPQSAGKVREEVNPRLIRHYAGLGLIDESSREGKEARYGYRHLLQLLLTRRLLAEGYPAGLIQKILAGKNDADLRALLRGGTRLNAEPTNPALNFLEQVRRRSRLAAPGSTPPSAPSAPAPQPPGSVPIPLPSPPASPAPVPVSDATPLPAWTRAPLLPGLEVHVREDFQLPATPHERENLQHLFLKALKTVTRQPKRRTQR